MESRKNGKLPEGIQTWTTEEALEEGMISPEDAAYWETYLKAETQLHSSGIGEYKLKQALEQAKLLSANGEFQEAAEAFRERWGISLRLPPAEAIPEELFPETVLHSWVFPSGAPEHEWRKLKADLEDTLCAPFGLDWTHDCGLAVAAVCFGLTPDNLLHHWDRICITVAKETSPGVGLVLHHGYDQKMRHAGATLAIAYLANRLHGEGVNLATLPDGILEWVRHSTEFCRGFRIGDRGLKPLDAPLVIMRLKARPHDEPGGEPELYLRIRPETTKTDVVRTWPQVELCKAQLWGGETQPKIRAWRMFERDAEIVRVARSCNSIDEVIKEYDKLHPEAPLAVDGIISDDVRDLVRQVLKRFRDRGNT